MLGKSYVYAGKYEKAIEPLKIAFKAKPDMEEAKFYLAICGVGEIPNRVPPSIMIEQLENIAEIFEVQIANGVNRAAYSIGTKMLQDALEHQQGFDVLDLDIRTGKSGDFVLSLANNIVGVEPCMHLISQARNRRIDDKLVYNELITKTAQDLLKKEERKFDIVQAYFSSLALGDLTEFFELIAARLRPEKFFLLSAEAATGEGYKFNNVKMSFSHSAKYIEKIAKETGFEIVAQHAVNQQNPNTDLVFLLKKKN
jgi:predicted TPR repeat methyltransferase